MILYHGTYSSFDVIDLLKGRKFKDFGRGFYTTQLEEQARQWAVVMRERFASQSAIVQRYEFDESGLTKLQTLRFDEPSIEWAHFVMNNRNPRFVDFQDPLNNHLSQYDIVEGPVANDRIAVILDQFLVDLISGNALVDALQYKDLNHQISFHTLAAVEFLEKRDEYSVR
jgi:hypothetical protein